MIAFHILDKPLFEARLDALADCLDLNCPSLVLVDTPADSQAVDAFLWKYEPTSFWPHPVH